MATSGTYGSFIPTTNIWDVNQVNDLEDIKPELKELLVRLYQNLNRMSLVLNTKDSGFYVTNEFTTGQVYFPNPANSSATPQGPVFRQTLRVVVNFGPLPNAGVKSVPHNIPVTPGFTFTRIYGCASDTVGFNYIPLPYASPTLVDNIELKVTATDVVITTAADYSAYTVTYVILEYIKS